MSAPANLLTVWADLLLGSLAEAGVTDVVVSPGSRSTPFVIAAARRPELETWPVLDERAAAFFALGRSRATGQPTLLLCTSGTAPAHYTPAVIEAHADGVPLLMLTADRPPELQQRGAPQTIDQRRLYGGFAEAIDLGLPDPTPRALRSLRRSAGQAVALAKQGRPVQINAPARKPLEPAGPRSADELALVERATQVAHAPAPRVAMPEATPDAEAIARAAELLARAKHPILVAGPMPLTDAELLRDAAGQLTARGLPIFAEATSQLRFGGPNEPAVGAFDLVLRDLTAPRPDLVLEVGATLTSGAYLRWLDADGPAHRVVISRSAEADGASRADEIIVGPVPASLAALAEAAPETVADPAPLLEADRRAWGHVENVRGEWSEGEACRAIVDALPAGAILALGNSLPIRHVDRFAPPSACDLRVYSQRGVNGIDGWLAQVAGAAQASRRPAGLILGDVAFQHDAMSLGLARTLSTPLAIVILDNGGGRIFEQLPIAQSDLTEKEWSLFLTPPPGRVDRLAEAFDVPLVAVQDLDGLQLAMRDALAAAGPTIVHAGFAPGQAAELERTLRAAAVGR